MTSNALERLWKEVFVANIRCLVEDTIRVFVGRDVQSTVTLGQDSRCFYLDWN
jgi:hypothetical protein